MRLQTLFPLISAVLLLAACATTGTKYRDAITSLPSVAGGKARVIMYRENNAFGFAMQPSVMLDGVKVRDSVPGSFTAIAVKPGAHVVSIDTEAARRYEFKAAAATFGGKPRLASINHHK